MHFNIVNDRTIPWTDDLLSMFNAVGLRFEMVQSGVGGGDSRVMQTQLVLLLTSLLMSSPRMTRVCGGRIPMYDCQGKSSTLDI